MLFQAYSLRSLMYPMHFSIRYIFKSLNFILFYIKKPILKNMGFLIYRKLTYSCCKRIWQEYILSDTYLILHLLWRHASKILKNDVIKIHMSNLSGKLLISRYLCCCHSLPMAVFYRFTFFWYKQKNKCNWWY